MDEMPALVATKWKLFEVKRTFHTPLIKKSQHGKKQMPTCYYYALGRLSLVESYTAVVDNISLGWGGFKEMFSRACNFSGYYANQSHKGADLGQ